MENGKNEGNQTQKAEETPDFDMKNESNDNVEAENNKIEKKSEEISDELLQKIRSQIEFYFGDINMQRDKFLIEQTKLDEGWVPMSIMLKFKLLASLSTDVDTIVNALEGSELMEVSEDRKQIRRSLDKPLPVYNDAYRKAQSERTIYLKGFPQKDTTIQGLKDFFKDMGEIENIVMRKYTDKDKKFCFKGSIFVQFKALDDANALLAKKSLKYGDVELIMKKVEDYQAEKAKEREQAKGKRGKKVEQVQAEEAEEDTFKLPTGAILAFSGLPVGTDRESLKAAIEVAGHEDVVQKIVYIDHDKTKVNGHIRFDGENSAKPILERLTEKPVTIEDSEVTFELVEGDEETAYLNGVKKSMSQKRQNMHKNKRGRAKKGRGGFAGRGKKRSSSPGSGGPPKKAAKTF